MRLAVRILGLDLFSIDVSTDAEPVDDDKARDLSGGTTGSTPVGFTARFEQLDEDPGVER